MILSPSLGPNVSVGDISSGIVDGLMIPVTAETRLILVFFMTAEGEILENLVLGYASGGIGIL